ncbi:MAG TPA: PaaI family thioesterase [Terrimesophilobacter sp.]|nr:PaaI family thioesterase [Terrimesophilobacter sp.]HRP99605.1 PaaI family thioesterase [Terrimesophilobacter sp.]
MTSSDARTTLAVDPTKPAGELGVKLGIEFLELTPERAVGRMPVAGNTQPYGILHGGAHLVLAESLGSASAHVHAGPGRIAVGIEISASHSKAVSEGWVTGTCTAISLGRTLTVHEVVLTDDEGRRLSTVRVTNLLRDA